MSFLRGLFNQKKEEKQSSSTLLSHSVFHRPPSEEQIKKVLHELRTGLPNDLIQIICAYTMPLQKTVRALFQDGKYDEIARLCFDALNSKFRNDAAIALEGLTDAEKTALFAVWCKSEEDAQVMVHSYYTHTPSLKRAAFLDGNRLLRELLVNSSATDDEIRKAITNCGPHINCSGAQLDMRDCSKLDISYGNFRNAHTSMIDLSETNASYTDFSSTSKFYITLNNSEQSSTPEIKSAHPYGNLISADLTRTNFYCANLSGNCLWNAILDGTIFKRANLRGTFFNPKQKFSETQADAIRSFVHEFDTSELTHFAPLIEFFKNWKQHHKYRYKQSQASLEKYLFALWLLGADEKEEFVRRKEYMPNEKSSYSSHSFEKALEAVKKAFPEQQNSNSLTPT